MTFYHFCAAVYCTEIKVTITKYYVILVMPMNTYVSQNFNFVACNITLVNCKCSQYLILFAVMETHKIHVDKQELKKTSEILGVNFIFIFSTNISAFFYSKSPLQFTKKCRLKVYEQSIKPADSQQWGISFISSSPIYLMQEVTEY